VAIAVLSGVGGATVWLVRGDGCGLFEGAGGLDEWFLGLGFGVCFLDGFGFGVGDGVGVLAGEDGAGVAVGTPVGPPEVDFLGL
jgi:hypothetical protein